MPAIDPGLLAYRVDDPWTTEKINQYLLLREEIKAAFGQDLFYNSFNMEYGTTSLLRRLGFEPTFITTASLHGEDAEAPGSKLKAIEIKGCNYNVKNWKIPDITHPSFNFSFDKIRQQGTREKIERYDGYALGVFDTNYKARPHWVQVHHFEPIVLMYITGNGATKLTSWILQQMDDKLAIIERDQIALDNSHQWNRIQPKYADVFNLLTNHDMRLIVNGYRMSKNHYKFALDLGDLFWEQEMWKKSLTTIRSSINTIAIENETVDVAQK